MYKRHRAIILNTLYINILFTHFREKFEHTNVTFNDNGTLSTIPMHPLKYIPELSNGTEEDILILPNIALLVSIISFFFNHKQTLARKLSNK